MQEEPLNIQKHSMEAPYIIKTIFKKKRNSLNIHKKHLITQHSVNTPALAQWAVPQPQSLQPKTTKSFL